MFNLNSGDAAILDDKIAKQAERRNRHIRMGSSAGEQGVHNDFTGETAIAVNDPGNAVPPIFEYSHDSGGCVVTGGYVYRGRVIAGLQGAYVFADYCLGRISALVQRDGHVVDQRTFSTEVPQLASFGEDADGELYALSLEGPVYRLAEG